MRGRSDCPGVIPIFDGHNDTITREDAAGFAEGRSGGHIDLPRARAGGLAGGIFAIFSDTPGYESDFGDGQDGAYAVALAAPIGADVAAGAAADEAVGVRPRDRVVVAVEDRDHAVASLTGRSGGIYTRCPA